MKKKEKLTFKDFIKHVLRIVFSIGAIMILRQYWIPKDFLITIFVYMGVYIFISLIIESIFNNKK